MRHHTIHPTLALIATVALLAACAFQLPGTNPVDPGLSEARKTVVSNATAQINAPYRYGGTDRKGFGNAGLMHFAYAAAGIGIPNRTPGQLRAGRPIEFGEALPGDLLFYRLSDTGDAEPHVGMFIGSGEMVHASVDRDQVVLETVDNAFWQKRLAAVIRILP
ncbi:C40 family peptidase [Spectribacter hydrogenooxidans]|uniref:NlpC/P60 family protein n=1 Tax=Spectribacter hydrogenoxidans TaxID=3075608 RepID=A0ABU3BXK7_9GAMM|nr:NlpC/P60 family protein [Salinisphaera sp. W335]MDT0634044.1 NlpC/P60 family protein [Salinisphaera sp. W335]